MQSMPKWGRFSPSILNLQSHKNVDRASTILLLHGVKNKIGTSTVKVQFWDMLVLATGSL